MSNDVTALAKPSQKEIGFRDFLYQFKGRIEQIVPKHLTADRLLRIALLAGQREPGLLDCSPQSMILAVMQCAMLGLEPGGPLGHAYLIPFKGQVQFIPGYRGLVELATRSGNVLGIRARAVFEKDEFDFDDGLTPTLHHRPYLKGDPGELVAVYAIAELPGGYRQADVMSRFDVDRVRQRSRASENGPWKTDYAEMAKKTVVRRLCKMLPLAAEKSELLAAAIEADNRAERGIRTAYTPVLDDAEAALEGEVVKTPAKSKVEQLADAKAAKSRPAPATPAGSTDYGTGQGGERPEPGADG